MSGVRPGGVEDRYVAPLEANRRGAHRARPNPLLGVLPLVGVAAVVVAVAAGVMALVGGGGLLPQGDKTVAGSTIATSKPAASTAKPSATASTPVASPSKSATVAPSQSSEPTDSAAAEVDKKARVSVYNATSPAITGLAGKVTSRLRSADWTKAVTVRTDVISSDTTIIYYADNDLKATAQALADDLGVGELKKSSSKSGGSLAVYVGNDYRS